MSLPQELLFPSVGPQTSGLAHVLPQQEWAGWPEEDAAEGASAWATEHAG